VDCSVSLTFPAQAGGQPRNGQQSGAAGFDSPHHLAMKPWAPNKSPLTEIIKDAARRRRQTWLKGDSFGEDEIPEVPQDMHANFLAVMSGYQKGQAQHLEHEGGQSRHGGFHMQQNPAFDHDAFDGSAEVPSTSTGLQVQISLHCNH
jgi:hypothetical protein